MITRSQATLSLGKLLSPTFDNFSELYKIAKFPTQDWEQIINVANRYLLIPSLQGALKSKNILQYIEDQQLTGYLQEMYNLNEQRNLDIMKQVQEISEHLQSINIKPILLKGSAALFEEHYGEIGERVMMDIDILVPEKRVFEAIDLLKEKAYKEMNPEDDYGENWHHWKRLYQDEGTASVEIHRWILSSRSVKYFPNDLNDSHLLQSTQLENASVIEPTYELFHSFLHTQISHNYHQDGYLALRHIHHFTVMLVKHEKKIDWDKLQSLIKEYKLQQIFEEYLYLIYKIFDVKTPIKFANIKKDEKYLAYVYRHLDNYGSFSIQAKILLNKFFYAFSYGKLKKHYKFENRFLLIFYIPKRFLSLLFSYLFNRKKLKGLKKDLKIAST